MGSLHAYPDAAAQISTLTTVGALDGTVLVKRVACSIPLIAEVLHNTRSTATLIKKVRPHLDGDRSTSFAEETTFNGLRAPYRRRYLLGFPTDPQSPRRPLANKHTPLRFFLSREDVGLPRMMKCLCPAAPVFTGLTGLKFNGSHTVQVFHITPSWCKVDFICSFLPSFSFIRESEIAKSRSNWTTKCHTYYCSFLQHFLALSPDPSLSRSTDQSLSLYHHQFLFLKSPVRLEPFSMDGNFITKAIQHHA